MLYEGKIIWHGPDRGDRPLRQSLCRPVHPWPRRGADRDGGEGRCKWRRPRGPLSSANPAAPAIRAGAGVRCLRRLEHHRRGGGARRARPRASRRGTRPQASICSPWKARARRPPRRATGIAEFDRVAGGGLVPGSALLIGGDPGIGKSTLMLQVAAALGRSAGRPARSISPAKRRWSRCACAPRGWAWPRRRSRWRPRPRVRDILATLDSRPAARARRHRFHPDHVCRRAGCGAGHRRPGARLAAELIRLRQAPAASACCWSAMSPRTA